MAKSKYLANPWREKIKLFYTWDTKKSIIILHKILPPIQGSVIYSSMFLCPSIVCSVTEYSWSYNNRTLWPNTICISRQNDQMYFIFQLGHCWPTPSGRNLFCFVRLFKHFCDEEHVPRNWGFFPRTNINLTMVSVIYLHRRSSSSSQDFQQIVSLT